MKMTKTLLAGSIAVLMMSSANAATEESTFVVGATVVNSCSVSAEALTFADIDPLVNVDTKTDGATTISVTCSNGTAYNIGLNAGTSTGATTSSRHMTSGVNLLDYALFTNDTRATNWGDTVGTDTVAGTGTGAAQSLNVYASVNSGQETAPVGAYSDTVTVTVTF